MLQNKLTFLLPVLPYLYFHYGLAVQSKVSESRKVKCQSHAQHDLRNEIVNWLIYCILHLFVERKPIYNEYNDRSTQCRQDLYYLLILML